MAPLPLPLQNDDDASSNGASTSANPKKEKEPIIRGMENYVEPIIIESMEEARPFLRTLRQQDKLGVEFHGINVGLNGSITLAVIASFENGVTNVHIFDVMKTPALLPALKPILENPNILKITHDVRGDRTNLFKQSQIHLEGVFDTQIAHKYANGGKDKIRISFGKLLYRLKLKPGPMRAKFRGVYKTLPNLWEERPLTKEMKALLSMDMWHYETMQRILDSFVADEDREDFLADCEKARLTSVVSSAEF